MSERPGGFDQREIDIGFGAVLSAKNPNEIGQRIEELPVLQSPIFHAYFRQLRLQFQNQQGFSHFLAVYDAFFTTLHYRAYLKQTRERIGQPVERVSPDGPLHTPYFFLELTRLLDGRLPPENGPDYDATKDAAQIQAELNETLGRNTSVPEYFETDGSLWCAVIVACVNCGQKRLTIRANLIDLTRAPKLAGPLRGKRINADLCGSCGAQPCIPIRVWIQERPATLDPLATLSCVWLLSPSVMIYQPPPGTVRDPAYDRILEVRSEMLIRRFSLDLYGGADSKSDTLTMGVAYDLDELIFHLDKTAVDRTKQFTFLIQEITQKIESGLLPFHQAEQFIRKVPDSVLKDWPVAAITSTGSSVEALVRALISEVCAEAQEMPSTIRAGLAGASAQFFTALGQIGLAQTALARAKKLLSEVPSDESEYEEIRLSLVNVESELLSAQGQHQESEKLRRYVLESQFLNEESLEVRLGRQAIISNDALGALIQGRFAEALEALPKCISAYEALQAELLASSEEKKDLLREVRYNLSGVIANIGFAYMTISEHLDLFDRLHRGGTVADLSPKHLMQLQRIGDAESIMKLQEEILERTLPILERRFPNGYSPTILLVQAKMLIQQALAISEEVEGFDYAAIQAHRLALLLDELSEPEQAAAMMQQSIGYAARAEDYPRLVNGFAFFAQRAMDTGNGQEAIAHWKECVRFEMRDEVRRGGQYKSDYAMQQFGNEVLNCVAMGGEAITAIMIVESLKALSTAISLLRGVPLQADAKGRVEQTDPIRPILERRESLRLRVIWNPAERDAIERELVAVETELDVLRRDVSLRDPRYAQWCDATFLEVSDEKAVAKILKEIGSKTTLLGFLPVGDLVWTYALWDGDGIIAKRPIPSELMPLRDPRGKGAPSLDMSKLEAMAAILLEPVAERLAMLGPRDRLILSPYAPFDMLPFGTLPFQGRPLCQSVILSVVQGLSALEACARWPSVPIRSVLCIGAPKRPDDAVGLPGAMDEVSRITALFEDAQKQVQLLTGRHATVPALRKDLKDYDLVHIACHATMAGPDSHWAQLLLAPDLHYRDSGNLSEDRIVSELSLKPGCMVNLAGCSTGLQGKERQHLRSGLVPAFLVAGAGSVVASLWPIEDRAGSIFQSAYYRWITKGLSPAEALATTQRDCIAGSLGDDLRNAYNWSSYLIYGLG